MFESRRSNLLQTTLVALALALGPSVASATLLALNFTSAGGVATGDLIGVNSATGAGAVIGNTSVIGGFGLADRGKQLYSFDQTVDRLIEIDPSSGATLAIVDIGSGDLGGEGSLSFRSDGLGFITYTANQIASFDLTSGTFTNIGAMAVQIDGLDFAADGTLYGLSQTTLELYIINTATAGVTLVGDTGLDDTDGTAVAGLTFATDGTLFAALNDSLYTVNPATGAATLVGGPILAGRSISGLTAIDVPEPASLSLLGLGLLTLLGRRLAARA